MFTVQDVMAVYESSSDAAERYAEALLAILGMPWECDCGTMGCRTDPICPICRHDERRGHEPGCAFLIAARACGIA